MRSDLLAGLECVQSYTRRCLEPENRYHFNQLYHGTGEVIHELCDSDSKYQEGTYVFLLQNTQNRSLICQKVSAVLIKHLESSRHWINTVFVN